MVPLFGRGGYWGVDGAMAAVDLAEILILRDLTRELGILLVYVGVVLARWREFLGVEQHLLRVDEVGPGEVGQLRLGAPADRIHLTRFFAVAAEDAADHVDLVDRRISFTSRYRVR